MQVGCNALKLYTTIEQWISKKGNNVLLFVQSETVLHPISKTSGLIQMGA
jgi:hypothetical protein